MTDITRLSQAQIQLDKFLLVRLHEGVSQYGELYDAAAGAFPGNAVALWYEARESLARLQVAGYAIRDDAGWKITPHGRTAIDRPSVLAELARGAVTGRAGR